MSNATYTYETMTKKYDLFICHASEDKDSLVRPLAQALQSLGASVWYDEFSLKLGDSLSSSIDTGIADSEHGVVVISRAFFEKKWTKRELGGLVAQEMAGEGVIIPIFYGVTVQQVRKHSPTLADKVALVLNQAGDQKLILQDAALKILKRIRPDLITEDSAQKLDDKIRINMSNFDVGDGPTNPVAAAAASGVLDNNQSRPPKLGVGFKGEAKKSTQELEEVRQRLENSYPKWQHAAFSLNKTAQNWIMSDPEMRELLDVAENERRIIDPIVGSRQLDTLRIAERKKPARSVVFEAQPLWPPRVGTGITFRIELTAHHLETVSFHINWDGKSESPNSWKVVSSDGSFDRLLSRETFDELLGKVFPRKHLLDPFGAP